MGGRAKRPSYVELAAIVVELRAEVLQLKTRIVELEKEESHSAGQLRHTE